MREGSSVALALAARNLTTSQCVHLLEDAHAAARIRDVLRDVASAGVAGDVPADGVPADGAEDGALEVASAPALSTDGAPEVASAPALSTVVAGALTATLMAMCDHVALDALSERARAELFGALSAALDRREGHVLEYAAYACWAVARDTAQCTTLGETGIFRQLLELLKGNSTTRLKEATLAALWLAVDAGPNALEAVDDDGTLARIFAVASSDQTKPTNFSAIFMACGTLAAIATVAPAAVLQFDLAQVLVGTADWKMPAADALRRVALRLLLLVGTDPHAWRRFAVTAGSSSALEECVLGIVAHSTNPILRTEAVIGLTTLALQPAAKRRITALRQFSVIVGFLRAGTIGAGGPGLVDDDGDTITTAFLPSESPPLVPTLKLVLNLSTDEQCSHRLTDDCLAPLLWLGAKSAAPGFVMTEAVLLAVSTLANLERQAYCRTVMSRTQLALASEALTRWRLEREGSEDPSLAKVAQGSAALTLGEYTRASMGRTVRPSSATQPHVVTPSGKMLGPIRHRMRINASAMWQRQPVSIARVDSIPIPQRHATGAKARRPKSATPARSSHRIGPFVLDDDDNASVNTSSRWSPNVAEVKLLPKQETTASRVMMASRKDRPRTAPSARRAPALPDTDLPPAVKLDQRHRQEMREHRARSMKNVSIGGDIPATPKPRDPSAEEKTVVGSVVLSPHQSAYNRFEFAQDARVAKGRDAGHRVALAKWKHSPGSKVHDAPAFVLKNGESVCLYHRSAVVCEAVEPGTLLSAPRPATLELILRE